MQELQKPRLIQDLGMLEVGNNGAKHRFGLFECPICKKNYKAEFTTIKNNKSTKCRSCATINKNTKHNLSKHPLMKIWANMIDRTKTDRKDDYVKRGIKVCEEWNEFINFYNWSMANGYKRGLTIDRINNNGNYEPSNCRWATKEVQARNIRVIRANNTSGYKGVYVHKNCIISKIRVCGKEIYLGTSKTKYEASLKYDLYILENNLEHTINNKNMGILQIKDALKNML